MVAADPHHFNYLECQFREDNHGLKPEEIAAYRRKKAASFFRAQEVEPAVMSGGNICACQLDLMMNAASTAGTQFCLAALCNLLTLSPSTSSSAELGKGLSLLCSFTFTVTAWLNHFVLWAPGSW